MQGLRIPPKEMKLVPDNIKSSEAPVKKKPQHVTIAETEETINKPPAKVHKQSPDVTKTQDVPKKPKKDITHALNESDANVAGEKLIRKPTTEQKPPLEVPKKADIDQKKMQTPPQIDKKPPTKEQEKAPIQTKTKTERETDIAPAAKHEDPPAPEERRFFESPNQKPDKTAKKTVDSVQLTFTGIFNVKPETEEEIIESFKFPSIREKKSSWSGESNLVKTVFCWLPVKYYEIWIIFTVVGYFSLWFTLFVLSLMHLSYGITLCLGEFTLLKANRIENKWEEIQEKYYFDDPVDKTNKFQVVSYLKDTLEFGNQMLFKHGLIAVFLSVSQIIAHIHGFYSFYFRHSINLLIYSIILFVMSIVLYFQSDIFEHFTDKVILNAYKEKFYNMLDEKECNVCVPKTDAPTNNWTKLEMTDYLLKLQSCVYKCCGIDDSNASPLEMKLKLVPWVCCKKFHQLMFINDTVNNLPKQLKCVDTIFNSALPSYPYTNETCSVDEQLDSCSFKGNIYYYSSLRFGNFLAIFLRTLRIYYLVFCFVSILCLVERFFTRRRILKNIHKKLVRYKVN